MSRRNATDHTKKGLISKSKVSNVPVNPDNIYLDVIITNVLGNRTPAVPIEYTENRTNAIVDNAGNYCLSVVRFSLESQTLPVFIPTIQPNQGNRDLTIYSVTLKITPPAPNTTTFVSQQPIIWEPQNLNAIVPPPPNATGTGFQATFNDYYYGYNFDWFAVLVQKALYNAQIDLENQITAAAVAPNPLTGIIPPTISFDPTTLSFVLTANQSVYSNNVINSVITPNAEACEMYFNTSLYELLSTFPSQNYGTTSNITDGANFRITFLDFGGTSLINVPTIGTPQQVCIQVFQEFSTINNITPVSGIVFTSSQLPIVPNQLSAPQILSEGQNIQALSGNNSNFGLILTDLESGDLVYKPTLQYTPTAEYRRISLQSTQPISNIQISCFWRTKLGQLVPLTLASGASCTIKLLFTKVKAIYGDAYPDADVD